MLQQSASYARIIFIILAPSPLRRECRGGGGISDPSFHSLPVGSESCLRHLSLGDHLLGSRDIGLRPCALRRPRRIALHILLVVDALHATVDPPEADGLLDRFLIREGRLAGGSSYR